MKSWLVDIWIQIRASYWFLPSIMAIGAVVSALAVVQLDVRLGSEWLADYGWLYANRPAGAQALLSTVAGSMITVAGVTFSMTLLAVSHASAQIGPRLLTSFLRDQGNQITLGTFIATFLYCLIVLRTVHAGEAGSATADFVPHLAVLVAIALAAMSVVVLIYFIHHVQQSINVSNVISSVGDELEDGVLYLFPARVGRAESDSTVTNTVSGSSYEHERMLPVTGPCGYMRVLDADGLLNIAASNDLVVEILRRPGDFAIPGQPLMRVRSTEPIEEPVASALYGVFSWGIARTPEQDVTYAAGQLVEVLGKAMSPGINGQYTAILCLNQFERALAELLSRDVPSAERYDSDQILRVIAQPVTHAEFMALVFTPIRQFIRGDWLVTDHLLKMLVRLGAMPELEEQRVLLDRETMLLLEDIEVGSMVEAEKQLLRGVPGSE